LPELPRLPKIAEIDSAFKLARSPKPSAQQLFNLDFLAITNSWQLALSLFMFRVFADHAHHALAVHDLALVANLLYRRPNLHVSRSLCLWTSLPSLSGKVPGSFGNWVNL
jgi:hypothetical protein